MIILSLRRVRRIRGSRLKKLIFFLILMVSSLTLAGCGDNSAEYKSDLQDVGDEMLKNSAAVEGVLEQYSAVWRFSIESGSAIGVGEMMIQTGFDEETVREYFELNSAGNVPGDFSTNINSMNLYFEDTGKLDEIKSASDNIENKVSELNNPPSDYEKAYDEILDMYTYSEEYIEMALNPTGSLQSFNEERNRLSSDILSQHKRIEAVMPSEIKKED